MTGGFYEELGVDRTASAARIRQAYGVSVSRLAKRRRALLEQGGATVQLDLQRSRLDEAWAVLSDPLRRRRYDAMLAWTDGDRTRDPDALWDKVGEALVHPAAAVAVKLLRVTSRLPELGQLPLAPSAAEEDPATLIPHDDDLTSPRIGRAGRAPAAAAPTGRAEAPRAPASAPPLSAPPAAPAPGFTMPRPAGPRAVPSIAPPMLATPAPVDPRDLIELTPAPAASRPGPPRAPGSSPPLSYASPAPFASAPPAYSGPSPTPSQAPTATPAPPRPTPPTPKVTALSPEAVSALVDDHGWSGRMLALVRQRMGLQLQEVADHTRIGLKYLEAIESEAREKLPSSTFVRGYVRAMARLYQLDETALVTGYMRRFDGA